MNRIDGWKERVAKLFNDQGYDQMLIVEYIEVGATLSIVLLVHAFCQLGPVCLVVEKGLYIF
jgi:hypothetical protein